jgi:hypothetical protein
LGYFTTMKLYFSALSAMFVLLNGQSSLGKSEKPFSRLNRPLLTSGF